MIQSSELLARSLREVGLDRLGLLEMRLDRVTHLLQAAHQLLGLRSRQQLLVDRIEDLLMLIDLTIDVRGVEGGAVRAAQRAQRSIGSILQYRSVFALGGRQAELLEQLGLIGFSFGVV